MTNIIPFLPKAEIEEEIKALRQTLSQLILTYDNLRLIECPNIERAYLLTFGSLESQLHDAEIQWRRSKRLLEMLIQARNHRKQVNLAQLDRQLDQELMSYYDRLESLYHQINDAIDYAKLQVLSSEESRRLNQLYRQVVKALHPDLNPELSEEEKGLFLRAVEAYENGQLQILELIAQSVSSGNRSLGSVSVIEEKQRLEEIIRQLESDIEQIQTSFPYRFKEILEDSHLKEAHRGALQSQISEYQERASYYQTQVDSLLEQLKEEKRFD